jgi:hypothetical protein
VQDFIRRTIEQARADGFATSLLGRRRPVPELPALEPQTRSLGERLAVNFVMQGSNADIIKVAMIAIHRRLREEGRALGLVLQIHDELLLEAPRTRSSRVKDSSARRCRALTTSTRHWPSTWASATTGTKLNRESPARSRAMTPFTIIGGNTGRGCRAGQSPPTGERPLRHRGHQCVSTVLSWESSIAVRA